MRLLITGGTGVLGRPLRPVAEAYNVCRDGERVSTDRFTQAAGWHPQR
jgi:nucleoside-diphosphate-sugar epimerase